MILRLTPDSIMWLSKECLEYIFNSCKALQCYILRIFTMIFLQNSNFSTVFFDRKCFQEISTITFILTSVSFSEKNQAIQIAKIVISGFLMLPKSIVSFFWSLRDKICQCCMNFEIPKQFPQCWLHVMDLGIFDHLLTSTTTNLNTNGLFKKKNVVNIFRHRKTSACFW